MGESGLIDDWVSGYRGSTRYQYPLYLREFLGWLGFGEDEALRLRQEDLECGDRARVVRFEGKVREYMAYLDGEGRGYSFRHLRYSAIKSFFEHYDLALKMRRKDAPKGEYDKARRPPTKDEIRLLLDIGDLYERSLVLFLKDTGIGISDLAALKLRNFVLPVGFESTMGWREWLTVENAPLMVTGIRQKTRVKFKTFVGAESIEALRLYFDQREKGTQFLVRGTTWKTRAAGVPPEKIGLDSSIFRHKTDFRPATGNFFGKVVEKLCTRAGLNDISAHCFRHYFQNTLENLELNLNPNWIRRMMGHKVQSKGWDVATHRPSTNPAYSHPEDEELRQAYIHAYPLLTVKPRRSRIDEERLRSLEEKYEEERDLRAKAEDRLERLEKTLSDLADAYAELKREKKLRGQENRT